MRKRFLITVLIIISYTSLFACSCVETNESFKAKVERAFSNADLIFIGKVVSKEIIKTEIYVPKIKGTQKYVRAEITFEVTDVISGEVHTKTLNIVTSDDEESCGYNFKIGNEYLVYSHEMDRRLTMNSTLNKEIVEQYFATGLCTRTNQLDKIRKREINLIKRLAKKNN